MSNQKQNGAKLADSLRSNDPEIREDAKDELITLIEIGEQYPERVIKVFKEVDARDDDFSDVLSVATNVAFKDPEVIPEEIYDAVEYFFRELQKSDGLNADKNTLMDAVIFLSNIAQGVDGTAIDPIGRYMKDYLNHNADPIRKHARKAYRLWREAKEKESLE